jgi:hypothetical protein
MKDNIEGMVPHAPTTPSFITALASTRLREIHIVFAASSLMLAPLKEAS